jgi:hypothetical protein
MLQRRDFHNLSPFCLPFGHFPHDFPSLEIAGMRRLEADSVVVVHVDWRPPSGGPNVAALLARLGDDAS